MLVEALGLAALVAVPLYAWRGRGRGYAIFGFVVLALSLPGALAMHARLRAWWPAALAPWITVAFAYPLAAAGLHLASLVRARLRGWPFRILVSLPGLTFIGAGFLSGLWLLALAPVRAVASLLGWEGVLHLLRWLDVLPFVAATVSVVTSLRPVEEVVRIRLDTSGPPGFTRLPVERHRRRRPAPGRQRPLRIVQIADPHLGPWQPVAVLQRRLERLVAARPDLVLLTGDYLTMEGTGSGAALAEALAPLARMHGRCFSVLGNHDHDDGALPLVEAALAANGIHLLVDDEHCVETPVGPVQLVGVDWVSRQRREHMRGILARYPRRAGHVRLLLLHDPSLFPHVPAGEVDLTLSGHTHGGQVGLVSLGLRWTVLSRSRWPDHGLFGLGPNRLYVHRGTGFYGFPLRVGVPGEASLLEVVPVAGQAAARAGGATGVASRR
jgi:hypothetical protein